MNGKPPRRYCHHSTPYVWLGWSLPMALNSRVKTGRGEGKSMGEEKGGLRWPQIWNLSSIWWYFKLFINERT